MPTFRKDIFRLIIGVAIIMTHFLCVGIVFWKDAILSPSQQYDTILLLAPITVVYITAIIRAAIADQNNPLHTQSVSLFYGATIGLVTLFSLIGLLYTFYRIDGTPESSKFGILIFETAFGGIFGLVVTDLFGKLEVVEVPVSGAEEP